MDEMMMNNEITPFAATNFRNRRVFGIKADDRRRHMYIIGKTGMGKSTMLENLVYTDILKGHGVAYVDPHGDTAEKMLQWIPKERIKDVIYFNPADRHFPIAFNVLENVDVEFRNLVASGLVSVYKKLWADSWGPRLEYILRYTILALLDSPDSTLLGINRMLVDEKFRKIIVARVTDPVVRSFWEDEFSQWNERNIAEVISPIQNKVGQFLSNTMIRNIVGQVDSSFDLRKMMDERKIIIMNLSKGRMGEDASALLGAMMITKIQLAAMSRVDIPEEERKDFYLYVDEFQNFATESFATILSEARKYRLCLTMAHQYIAQLEQGGTTAVRDAVFGNVGTLVTFRVGAADAEFLEKEFAPQFLAEDIINLPKYKIYLRLMIDGVATEPFSADALPPLASKDFGNGQAVIDYTRETYAKRQEDVEKGIMEWQRAEGGILDKNQLIGSTKKEGDSRPSALEVFEQMKQEDEKREQKEKEKEEERKKRQSQPVVYRGISDASGEPIELKFIPDPERPILSPEDLRLYRKGALRPEQFERLTEKVTERKMQFKKGASVRDLVGGQVIEENLTDEMKKELSRTINASKGKGESKVENKSNQTGEQKNHSAKPQNKKPKNNHQKKESPKRELPPIHEDKPQIRIVGEFSDKKSEKVDDTKERREDNEVKKNNPQESKDDAIKTEKPKVENNESASNLRPIKPGDTISFD